MNRYRPKLKRGQILPTERELVLVMNDDSRAAFRVLKDGVRDFGNLKVYQSAKAIMFARRVCFMFVRPKKSHLELRFFLEKELNHPSVRSSRAVSKTKFSHLVRIVHPDQFDTRLRNWLREAYELSN